MMEIPIFERLQISKRERSIDDEGRSFYQYQFFGSFSPSNDGLVEFFGVSEDDSEAGGARNEGALSGQRPQAGYMTGGVGGATCGVGALVGK